MARTKISANEAMENALGDKSKSESSAHIYASAEAREKIRSQVRRKYAEEDEKFKEKLAKKLDQYDKKLNRETSAEKRAQAEKEFREATTKTEKLKSLGKGIGASFAQAIGNVTSNMVKGIDDYIGVYSRYMSDIETRLQGSGKTFGSVTGILSRGIGASQYVSQKAVLENLSKLVQSGISYNVEQRALLETVSDKIAATFNSFDSSLMRIIRIQQADSTVARLGMESELTKFFNANFQDTSYLQGLSKAVSGELLNASSTLGKEKSVEFEYTVQKWLGSLSSVGVSDRTIQQLAQGIGYLGSGDISSLSGNQALQNLLVMASNRDFGSFMSGGLDAAGANKLLSNIVRLSQEIANTNNRVVLSQYAKIFGMDISDLIAMTNLTANDMVTISENMLGYGQLEAETSRQIGSIGSRMTLKDRIDTMLENVMSSTGEGIANSAGMYTTWVLTDLVEKATGGIMNVAAMPFGMGTSSTVTQLIKTGIVGLSTLSKIGEVLGGLSSGGSLNLSRFGASSIVSRGRGLRSIPVGVSESSSQMEFVGNSSSSDIFQNSIVGAKEQAESVQGDQRDLGDIIENDIAGGIDKIIQLLSITGIVIRGSSNAFYNKGE